MNDRTGQVWEFSDEHTVETHLVLRSHDMYEWVVFFIEKNRVTQLFESTFLASEAGHALNWRRLA